MAREHGVKQFVLLVFMFTASTHGPISEDDPGRSNSTYAATKAAVSCSANLTHSISALSVYVLTVTVAPEPRSSITIRAAISEATNPGFGDAQRAAIHVYPTSALGFCRT